MSVFYVDYSFRRQKSTSTQPKFRLIEFRLKGVKNTNILMAKNQSYLPLALFQISYSSSFFLIFQQIIENKMKKILAF